MAKKTSKKTRSSKSATARNRKGNDAALPQASNIPEGMQQIGGGYAPTWKPEKPGESVHGHVVGDVRSVEMTIGRKKQERRCFEVKTKEGDRFTIWESAALGELFDMVADGMEVFIQYDGLGKAKKGQNPPKLFTVAAAA